MNRIIIDATDRTKELNNYHGDTIVLSTASAIYISSFFKFNHLYFDLDAPETVQVSDVKVSLCDGSSFNEAADLIDETYGFTRSGFITFTPGKSQVWTSAETSQISELSSVELNQRYWIKIEGTFTALEINWIGNLFTDDNDIKDEFYDLCSADMFAAMGTDDHLAKHIRAAELIVNQLKTGNIIYDQGALLSRSDYRPASTMKVAEMIYMQLGSAYVDQMNNCRKEVSDRMSKTQPKLDVHNNATETRDSGTMATGRLYR